MKYDPHIKHLYCYYLSDDPRFFSPKFLIDHASWYEKNWGSLAEIKYKCNGKWTSG